jgi:hypothetical protein
MENNVMGVIKLGQLKRIQVVLNKNWKKENRFEINWDDAIKYIQRGKGSFLPVNVSLDLLYEKYDFQPTKDNFNRTKKIVENNLKFKILQS